MSAPLPEPRTAVVADGRRVTLRPLGPSDRVALVAFHATLSDDSIYLRWFTLRRELSAADLDLLTDVDGRQRLALAAVDDAGAVVAVGRFMRFPDAGSDVAELAFLVTDSWHGQGMGKLLLAALREAAPEVGIDRFTATVLATNGAMLAVLERCGLPFTRRRAGSTVELELRLADVLPQVA